MIREIDGAATEHPNNKQLPAKRLGWAALNVVYGMEQFPAMVSGAVQCSVVRSDNSFNPLSNTFQGPFPLAWASEAGSTLVTVTIDYTEHFHYLPVENSGFFFCCSQSGWDFTYMRHLVLDTLAGQDITRPVTVIQ